MDSQLLCERREERPTGRLPTFDASMRTAADPAKMKPRRYAAALMLLVLAISMAGGGSIRYQPISASAVAWRGFIVAARMDCLAVQVFHYHGDLRRSDRSSQLCLR